MPLSFRLFSWCPRIKKQDGQLIASTAWRHRILMLGWVLRRVIVDPARKELLLRHRYLWLIPRRRRIPFDQVEAVTYGYKDLALSTFSWGYDSKDLFFVGLRLRNGEEVHLFYFYGEGTFNNQGPLPDWLYWQDYLFDMTGTQEKESRAYAELLKKMIGVKIIPGRG